MRLGVLCICVIGALHVSVWDVAAQDIGNPLRTQGCLQCHDPEAGGRGVADRLGAPDLASRLVPDYTVPALAAALWNHTPTMWADIAETVTAQQPALDEAQWEDVFRRLYLLQFSDRPARAGQGAQVFESTCAACHGVESSNGGPGKPVTQWERLSDPIALVYRMWDHAASMKEAFGDTAWKKLDAGDLLDVTVYLQSVQRVPRNQRPALPDPTEGGMLMLEYCGTCHGGSRTFATEVKNKTLMDIGAAAWNHVPILESVPALSHEDFRKIVAYTWELQYRGPDGKASRGEDVFRDKGCISCHRVPSGRNERPLSPRPGKTFTPYSMAALGWGAGREMHRQMEDKGIEWPELSPDDVSDLVAYLNTLGR